MTNWLDVTTKSLRMIGSFSQGIFLEKLTFYFTILGHHKAMDAYIPLDPRLVYSTRLQNLQWGRRCEVSPKILPFFVTCRKM